MSAGCESANNDLKTKLAGKNVDELLHGLYDDVN